MINALMPLLASAILSASGNPLPPQTQTSAINFNRVLPEDNFVAKTIDKDETLKIIAISFYGDKKYWTNIWNDNPEINDPDQPLEGQFIKIKVSKPEKTADLNEKLNKRYLTLHPKPVYRAYSIPVPVPENTPPPAFEEVYKSAGAKYNIPWQILYGIHMTETGGRDGSITSGYGTGAQGPMQFMPGTWRAYGVDGDGDGNADINNAKDAINGAANYLVKHGSLENGLRSYGGNTSGILALARSKGYTE